MWSANRQELFVIAGGGDPLLNIFCRKVKFRSHHANNFAVPAAQRDSLPDGIRITSKPSLPQSVAKNDNALIPGFIFRKSSSEHCIHAEHGEEISGYIQRLYALRFAGAG